ncbi:hypothetical protein DSUL_50434 [Desulfovibrionales bacterium]
MITIVRSKVLSYIPMGQFGVYMLVSGVYYALLLCIREVIEHYSLVHDVI